MVLFITFISSEHTYYYVKIIIVFIGLITFISSELSSLIVNNDKNIL